MLGLRERLNAQHGIERLVTLVPWSWRRALYRYPRIASLIRHLLNTMVGEGETTITVSAGPLKGARLTVNMKREKYFWLGTHEPLVQEWLVSHVQPGRTVYDVGAHLGYFTLLLARLVGADGQVVAFEPDPANLHRLEGTMRLNCVTNVTVVPQAVTETPGVVRLVAGQDTLSHVADERAPGHGPSSADVAVPGASLDEMVMNRGLAPPHLIKVDVEGHEGKVLAGAVQVLQTHRPWVLCELHGYSNAEEVTGILEKAGYSLIGLEPWSDPMRPASIDHGGHIIGSHCSAPK